MRLGICVIIDIVFRVQSPTKSGSFNSPKMPLEMVSEMGTVGGVGGGAYIGEGKTELTLGEILAKSHRPSGIDRLVWSPKTYSKSLRTIKTFQQPCLTLQSVLTLLMATGTIVINMGYRLRTVPTVGGLNVGLLSAWPSREETSPRYHATAQGHEKYNEEDSGRPQKPGTIGSKKGKRLLLRPICIKSSWHGKVFRITNSLWGDFADNRRIPSQRFSNVGL